MKTFKSHFNELLYKFKTGENFAFVRFSDGELFVLQNRELVLSGKHTTIDGRVAGPVYCKEDHKEFIPGKHEFFRKKLEDSFKFFKNNYYVGISCKCCVGEQNNKYMLDLRGQDDEFLTWSNLFVNSNYPLFVEHFLPELTNKKIIIICNENANLNELKKDVNIVKDFRIGFNAMINNFHLYEDIKKYITDNNITDHVFLFSASSLSNITIFELFKEFDNNTYIDIGTTMNPFLGLSIERAYLKGYWLKQANYDLIKTCIW